MCTFPPRILLRYERTYARAAVFDSISDSPRSTTRVLPLTRVAHLAVTRAREKSNRAGQMLTFRRLVD